MSQNIEINPEDKCTFCGKKPVKALKVDLEQGVTGVVLACIGCLIEIYATSHNESKE